LRINDSSFASYLEYLRPQNLKLGKPEQAGTMGLKVVLFAIQLACLIREHQPRRKELRQGVNV
jgi:hypothetical protein